MKLKDLIHPKPNEEILMIVRESLVPKSGILFLYAIWFLVPFFFLYPLFRMGALGTIGFFLLVLSGIFLFWRTFRAWSHTLFVITDHRVIDIDQRGFFDRVVTESGFDHIDEVSYRMHGIFSTVFGYGTVMVKLHGTAADLSFRHIRNPSRVQDLLNDLRKTLHD
ncbi:MAG: PH domain-containing protein [Candidatus Uhrbacteria bacterium]|nr:PH domain-containing protein [Candidatus Uhrbacteria bacterium]